MDPIEQLRVLRGDDRWDEADLAFSQHRVRLTRPAVRRRVWVGIGTGVAAGVAIVALFALVLGGLLGPGWRHPLPAAPPSATATAVQSAPRCADSSIKVAAGTPGPALSQPAKFEFELSVTNIGAASCTLVGYPQLALVFGAGASTGTVISDRQAGYLFPPTASAGLRLNRGAVAHAVVGVVDEGSSTLCTARARVPIAMELTLPGTSASPLFLPLVGIENCPAVVRSAVIWTTGFYLGTRPQESKPSAPKALPTPTSVPIESARTAAEPPACQAGELTASLYSQHVGAAMGTDFFPVLLHNSGPAPCWLSGYPSIAGVTASGAVVPIHADNRQGPMWNSGPGSVMPGKAGVFSILASNPGNGGCSVASPVYAELQVNLPTGAVRMPWPSQLKLTGCIFAVLSLGPLSQ